MFLLTARKRSFPVGKLILVALLGCFVLSLSAQFAGGDGTENDPWQIATAEHLNNVREYLGAANNQRYFVLTANINLGVPPYNEGQGWVPIGAAAATAFQGKFDGGEFTISNLTIDRGNANYQALFGYVIGTLIENVTMDSVSVSGSGYVGALVGYADNASTIRFSSSNGIVRGAQYLGGLVGAQRGSLLQRSFSGCTVTGTSQMVGGLLGQNHIGARVEECYSTGIVTGGASWYTGGLVGYNQGVRDQDCGTIIIRSFSTGHVTGPGLMIGGLIGRNFGAIVSNCYSSASVHSFGSFSGCLIGQHCCTSTLINSYAVGAGNLGCATRGGLMCQQQTSVTTNSYWNRESTGQNTSAQGTVKNTEEMVTRATFVDWDFEDVWAINQGGSYPYFQWQERAWQHNIPGPLGLAAQTGDEIVNLTWQAPPLGEVDGYRVYRDGVLLNPNQLIAEEEYEDTNVVNFRTYYYYVTAVFDEDVESSASNTVAATPYLIEEGDGSADDPYVLRTPQQLSSIRLNITSHFILGNDIDLDVAPYNEGEGWEPIGLSGSAFRGTLNGDGYSIKNLMVNRTRDYQGFFGYIQAAQIRNVAFENVNVRGQNYTGAITGYQHSSVIDRVYLTGVVNGSNYVGGFSGWQASLPNVISNSYNVAKVHATGSYVGGFVGYMNNAGILNSYQLGKVTYAQTNGFIGALVGTLAGTGNINNSFWNIETVGLLSSAGGGEGLTASQMTRQGSFTDWDFEAIWNIGDGDDATYPWLSFQEEPYAFNYPRMVPPGNLFASVTAIPSVNLTWSAPSVGQPTQFRIYRNNAVLGNVNANVTEYADNNINVLTAYTYHVAAVYEEDESERSNAAMATPVQGGFSGGTGRPNDPYQIRTIIHLENVRHNPHANYLQTEDIDLVGVQNWNPIGTSTAAQRFTGSFNGNHHTISNLTVDRAGSSNQGFFGYVGLGSAGAILKNIILENASVTGSNFSAVLVGRTEGATVIDSCWVDGQMQSAQAYVGGLVGYNSGPLTIRNSSMSGSVQSTNNYIGGIVGYGWGTTIDNTYSTAAVSGLRFVGGFIGYHNGTITNSFSRGQTSATQSEVGGFAGYTTGGNIRNSYSSGRVGAPQDAANVGGFIGQYQSGTITNCYWDTQNSGQANSPQGQGRISEQMRHPHAADTYVDWDFVDVWRSDTTRRMNDGYPYLWWHPVVTGPNPDIATNPQPQHQAANISVGLEEVSWTYTEGINFTNPVGFRVYMNTTGEFGANAPYVWVAYEEGEENYATGAVLPEELAYRTTYHWKVVPTTIRPEGRGDDNRRRNVDNRSALDYRGDAENVPVWRFTTEINPNPAVATNPTPPDDEEDVAVNLTGLGWTYTINQNHANPAGFRVYLNTTGEFGAEDEFGWVAFSQHQANYNISSILPDMLDYATTYYWKVVPTTNMPNRSDDRRRLRNAASSQRYGQNSVLSLHRGDAENVPVWSFTTILASPNPTNATNPQPEHLATGISLGLDRVSWDYVVSEVHADPVGFRVYMNTTGAFGANAPYEWVDFEEGVETFYCIDVVPAPLDANTTYFWRVVPTTTYPTRTDSRNRNDSYLERSDVLTRGDAANSPVWRFTTGTTDVEEIHEFPLLTELQRNYPNPFNPETTISFSLAEAGDVVVEVYNSRGQQIATLVNDNLSAGVHNVVWNGRDNNNQEVGSGIYFYRMKSGSYTSTNKMILMK